MSCVATGGRFQQARTYSLYYLWLQPLLPTAAASFTYLFHIRLQPLSGAPSSRNRASCAAAIASLLSVASVVASPG